MPAHDMLWNMTDDDLLTPWEVANMFRVSRSTVARWVKEGRLPTVPTPGGKLLRFRRADVLAAATRGRPGSPA